MFWGNLLPPSSYPEERGRRFLKNISTFLPDHTAAYPRRWYHS
jgi:hypothetical protein